MGVSRLSPLRSDILFQEFKMSTAAAAPKAKKAAKPKAPASHPTYKVMTSAAIAALKEQKGSSRQGIIKYVVANYKLQATDPKRVNTHVKAALVRGLKEGIFKNSKGKGVTGSFKLSEKPKAPKKPKAKKTTTKKAAADKPKKPKSPKKKAAAKPKAAKSPAKKAAAKKPKAAKKPAVEKKPKAPKSPAKKAPAAKKPKAAKKSPAAKKTKAAKK